MGIHRHLQSVSFLLSFSLKAFHGFRTVPLILPVFLPGDFRFFQTVRHIKSIGDAVNAVDIKGAVPCRMGFDINKHSAPGTVLAVFSHLLQIHHLPVYAVFIRIRLARVISHRHFCRHDTLSQRHSVLIIGLHINFIILAAFLGRDCGKLYLVI